MDSTTEQTESTEVNPINEKVKQKLKEFTEFKCLYNLSNAALLFKRNISLLCQERIEKNLNINPKRNNYYSGKNSSKDVFNLKNIREDIFGEYISKHNINIEEEVKKMELEKEEKQKMGKKGGSKMEKKYKAIKAVKDQTENNIKDGKKARKNYNYYVVNDNKKPKGNNNNNVKMEIISNCKRSSVLDKNAKKENGQKKEEDKNKNIIIINSRDRNKSRNVKKEEKKEEKVDNSDKNIKNENTSKKKNLERNRSKNNFISSIKSDFIKNGDEKKIPKESENLSKYSRFLNKKENKTSPKKKNNENEIKKQKSYTYRRQERFGKNKSGVALNRFLNYSRSKSNKKIEKKDTLSEVEGLKKSKSWRKFKNKKHYHRHHHFQHFKKPKRIIAVSKLDSFSIISFN